MLKLIQEGTLEICFGLEDDIILSGNDKAVAMALTVVQEEIAKIGLSLSLSKCELICSSVQNCDLSLFPNNMKFITDGNFEYLGAPIGSQEFSNNYTQAKVDNLRPLFAAIANLENPQVAYFLLKNCSSFGKMVYSARVTPFDWHDRALKSFDNEVRFCFEQLTGIHSNDLQWSKACLSTKHGGLGFRQASKHSKAAFLASTTSSSRQCKFLDQNFVWDTISQHSHVSRALTAYNGIVLEENQVILTEASSKLIQKELSEAIDKASIKNIMDSSDFLQKAHFNLESAPRAGS